MDEFFQKYCNIKLITENLSAKEESMIFDILGLASGALQEYRKSRNVLNLGKYLNHLESVVLEKTVEARPVYLKKEEPLFSLPKKTPRHNFLQNTGNSGMLKVMPLSDINDQRFREHVRRDDSPRFSFHHDTGVSLEKRTIRLDSFANLTNDAYKKKYEKEVMETLKKIHTITSVIDEESPVPDLIKSKVTSEIEKLLSNLLEKCTKKSGPVKCLFDILKAFFSYRTDTRDFEFRLESFSYITLLVEGMINIEFLENAIENDLPKKMLRFLIQYTGMVNHILFNGRTPLYYAVELKSEKCILCLLDDREINSTVNVNGIGEFIYDSRPLHVAAKKEYKEIYRKLLTCGATQEPNYLGRSPLSYVTWFNTTTSSWWYYNMGWKNFESDAGSLLSGMLSNDKNTVRIIPVGIHNYSFDVKRFKIICVGGIASENHIQCRSFLSGIDVKWQYTNTLDLSGNDVWKDYSPAISAKIQNKFVSESQAKFVETDTEDIIDLSTFSRGVKEVTSVGTEYISVERKVGYVRWIPVIGSEEEEIEELQEPFYESFKVKKDEQKQETKPEEEIIEEEEIGSPSTDDLPNAIAALASEVIASIPTNSKKEEKYIKSGVKEIEIKNIPEEIITKEFVLSPPGNYLGVCALNVLAFSGELVNETLLKRIKIVPKIVFTHRGSIVVEGIVHHIREFGQIFRRIKMCYESILIVEKTLDKFPNEVMPKHIRDVSKYIDQRIKIACSKVHFDIWKEVNMKYIMQFKEEILEEIKKCKEDIKKNLKEIFEKSIKNDTSSPYLSELIMFCQNKVNDFNGEVHNRKFRCFQTILNEIFEKMIDSSTVIIQERDGDRFDKKRSRKVMDYYKDCLILDFEKEHKKTSTQYGCSFIRTVSRVLPDLLYRFVIFIKAYEKNLPLFVESQRLIDMVKGNDVTFVKTSTGSGKSTLLPLLLYASKSFGKIITTQPRRFPCIEICKYLEKTYGKKLVGFSMSGKSHQTDNPMLYVTDGMLAEIVLHNVEYIFRKWKTEVIIVDEVHERSINIDLLIALISELKYKKNHPLFKNVKIIFSSATLDLNTVKKPFLGMNNKVAELSLKNNSPFTIDTPKSHDWKQNPIECVKEINRNLKSGEKILCFLSSTSQVNNACAYFNKNFKVKALPLYAQQNPKLQEKYLQEGTIFFSTNIAETSITIPNLKHVVDVGKINVSRYNFELDVTELIEENAPESTKKQRKGRVGRTSIGKYYPLYDPSKTVKSYPDPSILRDNLLRVDFALRRSKLFKNEGILGLKKNSWPTLYPRNAIIHIIKTLRKLRFLDYNGNPTKIGKEVVEYPVIGGIKNCVSMYQAMNLGCADTMLRVFSILMSLPNNQSIVLNNIPKRFKTPEGDIMTLLNVFKESVSVRGNSSSVRGLGKCARVFAKASRRYKSTKEEFLRNPKFSEKIKKSNGDWDLILRCLLKGYFNSTFYSSKKIAGYFNEYIQLHTNNKFQGTIFSPSTTLDNEVSCFVALGVFRSNIRTDCRDKEVSINYVSILGKIDKRNMKFLEHNIKREFLVTQNEANIAQRRMGGIGIVRKNKVFLEGEAGKVMSIESSLMEEFLKHTKVFKLTDFLTETQKTKRMIKLKIEDCGKYVRVFNPLKWRWKNSKGAEIKVDRNFKDVTFTCKGREYDVSEIRKELESFMKWLSWATVLVNPNEKKTPTRVNPQKPLIEERVRRITDKQRTSVEIWESLQGKDKSREQKMEVVAWVAITKFECVCVGGFVRDWVVRGKKFHPPGNPSRWYDPKTGTLIDTLVPSDVDLELPFYKVFDLKRFQIELKKYDIYVDKIERIEGWRYQLTFDIKTQPFMVDFIEPHTVLTHDMCDFDVNNLYVAAGWTKEIGLRIDTVNRAEEGVRKINLDSIVENITMGPRFSVIRDVFKNVGQRIEKMKKRGWTLNKEKIRLVPYLVDKPVEMDITSSEKANEIRKIFNKGGFRVKHVFELSNENMKRLFEGNYRQVFMETKGNPNVKELFHGTKWGSETGIDLQGFDNRYWNGGAFGKGAYFADKPAKSNAYVDVKNGQKLIYIARVILGKQHVVSAAANDVTHPPLGYHSLLAKAGSPFRFSEYIVYRYGQALPLFKVYYT